MHPSAGESPLYSNLFAFFTLKDADEGHEELNDEKKTAHEKACWGVFFLVSISLSVFSSSLEDSDLCPF